MEYNDFKDWGVAERAMRSYAEAMRSERVEVRLHEPQKVRGWQPAVVALAMVLLVVGVAWLARPQVYGYVNGEPIYSLEEAQLYAHQMFDNMEVEELQMQDDILESIFSLE